MPEKKKKKPEDAQNAGVRTYRFDAALWAKFEEDCALNLYNPRAVLETLVFDWLATDEARAFMRAYRRGRERARRSAPAEVAAVLAEAGYFPGIDRSALARAVEAYQRLGCWDSGPEISHTAYERLLDVFQSGGLITRRHAYEAAVVPPPGP